MEKIFNLINFENAAAKYNCGENNTLYLFENADIKTFNKLISDIRSSGYREVQSSRIDNFFGYTFQCNCGYIVISYDIKESSLRIIFDDYSKELNTKPTRTPDGDVFLWQFEVDHSLIDCGMCYIFRCSDNSFFIIDSAHTYSVNDDRRIFELLRKETPSDLPVIVSGWFLSHGHIDHIGKFLDVLKYNEDIEIRGLYYNFVPVDHPSSCFWMQSDKNHTLGFLDEVNNKHNIPIYKLHSGQYFYIDKLRIDVLCTHEDVFPKGLENYNDSSTMLMVTVGENKICFPGDAGGEESKICENRFPDFLKCDIMQVSHHGHFGTSVEFYKMAKADVALFATTQIKFDEEFPRYEANRVACELAKHTFIASNGTVRFSFPLKDSEILSYPDETIEDFEGIFNLWGYDYTDEFKRNLISKFNDSKKFSKILY